MLYALLHSLSVAVADMLNRLFGLALAREELALTLALEAGSMGQWWRMY